MSMLNDITGRNWRVIVADVLDGLRTLPDESVQCCVTSPPYFGLRDYSSCDCAIKRHGSTGFLTTDGSNRNGEGSGPCTPNGARCKKEPDPSCEKCAGTGKIAGTESQIGLEKTPAEFIARLVDVFREVKRVLRADGVCFVNMGDSYNAAGRNGHGTRVGYKQGTNRASDQGQDNCRPTSVDLKPKDLLGIPWRLAFALQDDGWYLRSAMPWVKRSAMPESVNDRPASALEYVFLLAKSPRYYFDMEAVRKASSPSTHARLSQDVANQIGSERANGGGKTNGAMKAVCRGSTRKLAEVGSGTKTNGSFDAAMAIMPTSRNFRNADLWFESVEQPFGLCGVGDELVGIDATSEGYSESHFATFPSKLVSPLIKAGTSERGRCPTCGASWTRITEKSKRTRKRPNDLTKRTGANGTGNHCGNTVAGVDVKTTGWEPSCTCNAGEPVPCVVLDPFSGSGTTGMVATELCRQYIGIELNPDYAEMSRKRIESWKYRDAEKQPKPLAGQLTLLE